MAEQFAEKPGFRCPAPEGASDSEELTASLKRCPGTKREFSSWVRHFSLLRSGLRRTEPAPCGDSIAGHPSAIPLGFARGFGKTGQAFSKSVRSGAPTVG